MEITKPPRAGETKALLVASTRIHFRSLISRNPFYMLISLTIRGRDNVSCGHEWDGGMVDDLAAEYMTT